VASPFVCRSGHISAFAEATLPRDGQVGEGVSPALDASRYLISPPSISTQKIMVLWQGPHEGAGSRAGPSGDGANATRTPTPRWP